MYGHFPPTAVVNEEMDVTTKNFIETLGTHSDLKTAWQYYDEVIPAEIKARWWQVHDKVIEMVFNHPDKKDLHFVYMAMKANFNAIAAGFNVDAFHAQLLKVFSAYELFDYNEFPDRIFNDPIYEALKNEGIVKTARIYDVYLACKNKKIEIMNSPELKKQHDELRAEQLKRKEENTVFIQQVYKEHYAQKAAVEAEQKRQAQVRESMLATAQQTEYPQTHAIQPVAPLTTGRRREMSMNDCFNPHLTAPLDNFLHQTQPLDLRILTNEQKLPPAEQFQQMQHPQMAAGFFRPPPGSAIHQVPAAQQSRNYLITLLQQQRQDHPKSFGRGSGRGRGY